MADRTMYLLCEGPPDKRILAQLLNGKLGLSVIVKAVGGEDIPGGAGHARAGGVRAFLEKETPGAVAVSIQDRNYISIQRVNEGWADEKRKALLWRRHEIENYLLEPRIIQHAFRQLRESEDESVRSRYARLPDREGAIVDLLHHVARGMLEEHAARVVAWSLDMEADDGNPSRFRPRRPAVPRGTLAPGRAEWLDALHQEAARVQSACARVAGMEPLRPERIEQRYDMELARLVGSRFIEGGHFLGEMGGHELLSGLCQVLRQQGARFSETELTTMLTDALVDLYEPHILFPEDDFANLAERLRRLSRTA